MKTFELFNKKFAIVDHGLGTRQSVAARSRLSFWDHPFLRRRHSLGGKGSKIGQICRRIVVKNCRRRGVRIKNREHFRMLKWMVPKQVLM